MIFVLFFLFSACSSSTPQLPSTPTKPIETNDPTTPVVSTLTAGELHPNVDRLNGRQLQFENVILMFAEHIVITPTIVNINVAPENQGNAYLFRNGKMYKIKWSTVATEYQQKTGRGQPMRFINPDGTPAALKPGHTWVIIFNLDSRLEELSLGSWRARFVAPAGAKTE